VFQLCGAKLGCLAACKAARQPGSAPLPSQGVCPSKISVATNMARVDWCDGD